MLEFLEILVVLVLKFIKQRQVNVFYGNLYEKTLTWRMSNFSSEEKNGLVTSKKICS